jgi:hypothetical protein
MNNRLQHTLRRHPFCQETPLFALTLPAIQPAISARFSKSRSSALLKNVSITFRSTASKPRAIAFDGTSGLTGSRGVLRRLSIEMRRKCSAVVASSSAFRRCVHAPRSSPPPDHPAVSAPGCKAWQSRQPDKTKAAYRLRGADCVPALQTT